MNKIIGHPLKAAPADDVPQRWELGGRWPFLTRVPEYTPATEQALRIDEVSTLAHYAAERGINEDCDILTPLFVGLQKFDDAQSRQERATALHEILPLYARLAKLTFSENRVNGRTIIDSQKMGRSLLMIVSLGALFFLLAIALDIGEASLVRTGEIFFIESITIGAIGKISAGAWSQLMAYVGAGAWGGVGACIYLARKATVRARDSRFDHQKVHGVSSRIFLGVIFGAVMANMFTDPVSTLAANGDAVVTAGVGAAKEVFSIGPSAVAFLSGLGVKAIYAGFERMVDGIHGTLSKP